MSKEISTNASGSSQSQPIPINSSPSSSGRSPLGLDPRRDFYSPEYVRLHEDSYVCIKLAFSRSTTYNLTSCVSMSCNALYAKSAIKTNIFLQEMLERNSKMHPMVRSAGKILPNFTTTTMTFQLDFNTHCVIILSCSIEQRPLIIIKRCSQELCEAFTTNSTLQNSTL
jgi:hypothetical protein